MYKYDRLYLREDSQTPLKILHMEDIYICEQLLYYYTINYCLVFTLYVFFSYHTHMLYKKIIYIIRAVYYVRIIIIIRTD